MILPEELIQLLVMLTFFLDLELPHYILIRGLGKLESSSGSFLLDTSGIRILGDSQKVFMSNFLF